MFCGLHVLHNLCIYAEKPLIDWEKNVEEEGTTHASFKKSSNSRTFDLLYEMYKLLSRTHGDQKSGKVNQWWAYLKKNRKLYCVSVTSPI